jgi:hypothetical protein
MYVKFSYHVMENLADSAFPGHEDGLAVVGETVDSFHIIGADKKRK